MKSKQLKSSNQQCLHHTLELLESRQLMTASTVPLNTQQLNIGDISGDSTVQLNGTTNDYNGDLQLTPGYDLASSAIETNAVPVGHFTTGFEINTNNRGSRVYTDFVIENGPATAVGADGADAGYSNGTMPVQSLAIVIDSLGDGTYSSIALTTGGEAPTNFIPTTIPSGDLSAVTINYSNGQLEVAFNDEVQSATFDHTFDVNVPQVVESDSALVGFAGGTGDDDGTNGDNSFVRNWTYSGNLSPYLSTAPSSTSSGNQRSVNLVAGATPTDGSAVTYAWAAVSKPSRAAAPVVTGATSADASASFDRAGTYVFAVTASDADGESTTQDVTVNVNAVATVLKVTPHAQLIKHGKHAQFSAALLDQFGHTIANQTPIKFYVTQGSGRINASSGFFTAGNKLGHLEITARTGDLLGTSGETIV